MKTAAAFRPHVVAYEWWEIFCMRAGLALLLWLRLPSRTPQLGQPYPNGIAHWFDLTFLSDPAIFQPLRWIFLGMLIVYVSGRATALALCFLLFLQVGCFTLGNSQGWIGHTDQIISLVLLVQTILHLRLLWPSRRPRHPHDYVQPGNLEIFCTLQTIAATYVVAALTKILKTSGFWFSQLPNIPVQIVKTNDQFYYDHLVHPHPGLAEWLGQLLLAHPCLVYPLFGPGLLVELSAFFIPFGRKAATLLGLILLLMHLLIRETMQITFVPNIILIVVYLINLPFLLMTAFRWLRRKIQRPSRA